MPLSILSPCSGFNDQGTLNNTIVSPDNTATRCGTTNDFLVLLMIILIVLVLMKKEK